MANIAVIGLGYVGLANALVLARKNRVVGFDIDENKIDLLDRGISPIDDPGIQDALKTTTCEFICNKNTHIDYTYFDYVFIALPTDYDETRQMFNMDLITRTVEDIITLAPRVKIVIKSTVPIGYTESLIQKFNSDNIIFMPEFLREGSAYSDCLNPSRIVFGTKLLNFIGEDIYNCCSKTRILYTGPTEAEAIKLFANTYLAMRVAYFNELDIFASESNLNSADIIKGVCGDNRIGDYYNAPSFGYGGYCLPKDTKQLLSNYTRNSVPQKLMSAIVDSNTIRKNYIVQKILQKRPSVVGIYKLAMKENSDNYRSSAIIDIIYGLQAAGVKCIIYDPAITVNYIFGCSVEKSFEAFSNNCDIIATNRLDSVLLTSTTEIFTCDRFYGE